MAHVAAYVTGHGFGHATRMAAIVGALAERVPDLKVTVVSTAPEWLFRRNLPAPFSYRARALDVGAVQEDSIRLDIRATLEAYAALLDGQAALLDEEAALLCGAGVELVVADIPAAAFPIARRAGVPGVGIGNFSWDWIYADYVCDFPAHSGLVEEIRSSYAQATLLLRLPLHGDLSAFPLIRDIPLVARTATLERAEVRRRLRLPQDERLVLLSFGGFRVSLKPEPLAPHGVKFITNQISSAASPPPWCCAISTAEMAQAGVSYEDLVRTSDVVVTKPGYGIVAECIANGTPMVYTPRGRFAEYACLTAGIETHIPHAVISNADLYAGRWKEALDVVFAQPRRDAQVDTNGAAVAAGLLAQFLGS